MRGSSGFRRCGLEFPTVDGRTPRVASRAYDDADGRRAFAEFERAMIRERTSAGLAAARAEGRINISAPTVSRIVAAHSTGLA